MSAMALQPTATARSVRYGETVMENGFSSFSIALLLGGNVKAVARDRLEPLPECPPRVGETLGKTIFIGP